MTKRDDGGPAFPRPASTDEHGAPCNVFRDQDGMSLRDWFAGQALAGLGTESLDDRKPNLFAPAVMKDRAEWAYRQADAMLAARKTEGEG